MRRAPCDEDAGATLGGAAGRRQNASAAWAVTTAARTICQRVGDRHGAHEGRRVGMLRLAEDLGRRRQLDEPHGLSLGHGVQVADAAGNAPQHAVKRRFAVAVELADGQRDCDA